MTGDDETPLNTFKNLMSFFHILKHANIYKALQRTTSNILEEEKFMKQDEAIRCALQKRYFLISKLFADSSKSDSDDE